MLSRGYYPPILNLYIGNCMESPTKRFGRTYPSDIKIGICYAYHIDTRWKLEVGRILTYPTRYSGQYHRITISMLGEDYLSVKVFGWYMNPNGYKKIRNKNVFKYRNLSNKMYTFILYTR